MNKFFKNKKGFTLVELVVVIAIIGILAGIAIPQFMDATASARGAKIVADMRTIQSAEMISYAKNGSYPTDQAELAKMIQGGWPKAPEGKATIAKTIGASGVEEIVVASGATYEYAAGADGTPGEITLNDKTLNELLGGEAAGGGATE